MNKTIYLRPLEINDALVSYNWRNNPKIWRHTGSKPTQQITPEIEREWLAEVLKRGNERRFAICQTANDRYIGNIFLTDIDDGKAKMHIFIGDIDNWGHGHAYEAACGILDIGFNDLKLDVIEAEINRNNRASLALGKRVGFVQHPNDDKQEFVYLYFSKIMYENKDHLKVI